MDKLNYEVIIPDNANYNFAELDTKYFKHVGPKNEVNEKIVTKPYSYWKTVFRLTFLKKTFILPLVILIVIVALSIFYQGSVVRLLQDDDLPVENNRAPMPPSAEHWFGLGIDGEDYWSEIWVGVGQTLKFILIITAIQYAVGLLIGLIWGYHRKVDIVMVEVTRFLQTIPSLAVWMSVAFLLGASYWTMILGVTIFSWVSIASLTRLLIILVRGAEYNLASKVLGTSGSKILRRNIIPKILPILVHNLSFAFIVGFNTDIGLAFFNFSLLDPNSQTEISLGFTLSKVLGNHEWEQNSFLIIIPVLISILISISIFWVGKVFADSLDPKNHYK